MSEKVYSLGTPKSASALFGQSVPAGYTRGTSTRHPLLVSKARTGNCGKGSTFFVTPAYSPPFFSQMGAKRELTLAIYGLALRFLSISLLPPTRQGICFPHLAGDSLQAERKIRELAAFFGKQGPHTKRTALSVFQGKEQFSFYRDKISRTLILSAAQNAPSNPSNKSPARRRPHPRADRHTGLRP